MKGIFYGIMVMLLALLPLACSEDNNGPKDNDNTGNTDLHSPSNFSDTRSDEKAKDCIESAFNTIKQNNDFIKQFNGIKLIFPEAYNGTCIIVIVVSSEDLIEPAKAYFGEVMGDFALTIITEAQIEEGFIPECLETVMDVLSTHYGQFMALKGILYAIPDFDPVSNSCFIRIMFDTQESMSNAAMILGRELEGIRIQYEFMPTKPPQNDCANKAYEILAIYRERILNTKGVVGVEVMIEGYATSDGREYSEKCYIVIMVDSQENVAGVKAIFGKELEGIPVVYNIVNNRPSEQCSKAQMVLKENYPRFMNVPGVSDALVASIYQDRWYIPEEYAQYGECVIVILVKDEAMIDSIRSILGEFIDEIPLYYIAIDNPEPPQHYCEHEYDVFNRNMDKIFSTTGVLFAEVRGWSDGIKPDDNIATGNKCVIVIYSDSQEKQNAAKSELGGMIEDVPLIYEIWFEPPPMPDCSQAHTVFRANYERIMATEGVFYAYVDYWYVMSEQIPDFWNDPDDPTSGSGNTGSDSMFCAIIIYLKADSYMESAKATLGEEIEGVPLVYNVKPEEPPSNCEQARIVYERYREKFFRTEGIVDAQIVEEYDNMSSYDYGIRCYILLILKNDQNLINAVKNKFGESLEGVPIAYQIEGGNTDPTNCDRAYVVFRMYFERIMATNYVAFADVKRMPLGAPIDKCAIYIYLMDDPEALGFVSAIFGDQIEDIPVMYETYYDNSKPRCPIADSVFSVHKERILSTEHVVGAQVEAVPYDWFPPGEEIPYMCVIMIYCDSAEGLQYIVETLGESIDEIPLFFKVVEAPEEKACDKAMEVLMTYKREIRALEGYVDAYADERRVSPTGYSYCAIIIALKDADSVASAQQRFGDSLDGIPVEYIIKN